MAANPQKMQTARRTFVRQEKARAKASAKGSGNHARTRNQKTKGNLSGALDLLYRAPDHDWGPIPFTDADVPEDARAAAMDRAVQAMTEWGVVVEASRASGIGRWTLYKYMRNDPVFRKRMMDARRNNDERIEREMRRRGQLPKGELAAIFVMKHNIPRYREIQRVELTGKGGGPVAYADAKQELLRRLESIALKGQAVDAVVVGERPKLLRGGSGDGEEINIKKIDKGKGFQVKSRK